jgi:hypothetical protein
MGEFKVSDRVKTKGEERIGTVWVRSCTLPATEFTAVKAR